MAANGSAVVQEPEADDVVLVFVVVVGGLDDEVTEVVLPLGVAMPGGNQPPL